jgi:(E)-4-hydroxy-3-methylbut-2-enyl-diphosphate synthase
MNSGHKTPVILHLTYNEHEKEDLQLKAGADFGALLIDGFADGIMLSNKTGANTEITNDVLTSTMFGILQAARVRTTRTEYISCPGCGRTLFDLKKTISNVKGATSDFKGMKIGIMGCIVNGPGEMADADYGYVGAGSGRISLYKGKEVILKNIPEDEAVLQLLELIKKTKKSG